MSDMAYSEPEKITSRSTPSSSPGKRFPYQEDISLVEDVDLDAATPGEDINWLEDIELLQEDGTPAVFDRYSNSFLKIYFPIPAGPRERDRAQGADHAPAVRQLLRHPAEGEALQVPAARAGAVGRGVAAPSAPTGSRRCSRAGKRRCIDSPLGRNPLARIPARGALTLR